MRSLVLATVVATVVASMVFVAWAQNAQAPAGAAQAPAAQGAQPAQGARGRGTGADPYANNAAPGTQTFPLAAPAGKDSNARMVAPMGAVNQGPFDPGSWKYGTAFDAPPGSKVWNPVKLKMMQGGKVTGGTFFGAGDASTYCAMANAGYDFIWTEMQHDQRDWETAARIWRTCPHAKAVPGVRVAYTDEREIQHALDAGALVVVVPTVDTVEEAIEARNWVYFPPLGRRSNGGGQAFDGSMWGGVPGGYRNTINDNIVLILMIETLEGLKNSDAIAKVPGVTALFAASGDLGNFSGYRQGTPDYERAINIVHDAAIKANVKLCGPLAWRDRPDFTCFQAGSETAAIARGVKDELGALANTQPKPAVGPFAVKPKS
jgi:2-keto-3-deoxy-L-rhamnonate aldolase RhmA